MSVVELTMESIIDTSHITRLNGNYMRWGMSCLGQQEKVLLENYHKQKVGDYYGLYLSAYWCVGTSYTPLKSLQTR